MIKQIYFSTIFTLLCICKITDTAQHGNEYKPAFGSVRDIETEGRGDEFSNNNPEDERHIKACECYYSSRRCGCECSGTIIDEEFQSLMKSFQNCERFRFKITDASFFALPANLFSGIGSVKEFSLEIYNAICEHLLDPEVGTSPFRGVSFEDKAYLKLSNVISLRSWNWTPLGELESLSGRGVDIDIDGYGLRRLSSDFSSIASGSVKNVKISSSSLEMVGGGSFSSFENITRLLLPDNRIRSLTRSILPQTASKLEEIDLRRNSLYSLEPDMFTEMPSLKRLLLKGNPIRVIAEGTFKPILKSAHIDGISSFPLVCDCQIQWLKDLSLSNDRNAEENLKGVVCRRPPHLRGMPLRDLSSEHLTCS